ncbi:MAG: glycosyltransferase [Candidatus Dojkabacteria bacterium]|jgi:glycosyltransferase involved in cell wall biosynthesis|nr:glycosyltransferase [Candidatus Dojkabacteria bacterium]
MSKERKEQYDLISISHFFPPTVGGLENMAYNLLRGLSKKGISCIALFGTKGKYNGENNDFDTLPFKVFSIFNGTYPIFGIFFFFKLLRLLSKNPNSKVVVHSRHLTSSLLTSLACSTLKHPYTVIEHNAGQVYFRSKLVTDIVNWVDRHIFALVLLNSEDILTVSKIARRWISSNFRISKERIGIIYNSFETDFNRDDISKKENIVVFASKWIKVKDPQTTLKAYIELATQFPSWRFLMIGEGKDLEFDIDSLPKNIEIVTKLLDQKSLFNLLKKSKIYINSSLSEGLALGILEAISFGNIPVLSNARSNIEVANLLQTKEFTFTKENHKELVRVLKSAIYKSQDIKYINSLIEKNRETFPKEQMVQTYYERLLPRHYESTQMKTLSIVIPLYNEEATIEELLEKVSKMKLPNLMSKEIIIVNDASKDNSTNIVEDFVDRDEKNNKYILLKNFRNRGKSQTVKKGILASTGELVVVQDADLEYKPKDLEIFVSNFLENHNLDVIYGNRFNSKNKFSSGIHSIGNRFITLISNLFTRAKGFAPKDMETCYKMVRGDIMRSIFKTLESTSNFGLEPEVTAKLARYRKANGKRLNFKQIDIYYKPRSVSQGKKMRWFKHGLEALLEILYFNFTPFTIEESLHGKKIKRKF